MSKIKCIGIIAEDDSDFESSRILIGRIIKKNNLSFKKMVTHGCGPLKRKAFDHAKTLKSRGCDLLILIHDLDKKNIIKLESELRGKLKGNPFSIYFICIPIEEIEAWFLSDPHGIKDALSLKRVPKVPGLPETISSPKEKLGECIRICSDKKIYLNTKHNQIIATRVSIDIIKNKCNSFKKLHDFLSQQKF
jgi:hypothetical protein